MKPNRVIIYGASGFIGSAIVQALDQRKVAVTAHSAPRFLPVDGTQIDLRVISEESIVSTIASQMQGATTIINAAGIADSSSGDEAGLNAANALTPAILAAAANRANVPRFIHVSSAAVQGRLQLDESGTTDPLTPYARSKALGEAAVLSHGPAGTTIYRPPGVHSMTRSVTRKLTKLAGSPFASVVGPGDANTPQAQLPNVADAIAYLAVSDVNPPRIVSHPSERISTSQLLELLSGRAPRLIPPHVGALLFRLFARIGKKSTRAAANARRLEVLWFGQTQAASWLEAVGWRAPVGIAGWRVISSRTKTARDLQVAVISTVHDRSDIRVFLREADTISRLPGFQVVGVVADGNGDDPNGGYPVRDLGRSKFGRFGRFTAANFKALLWVLRSRPDIIHFHAPELIPICYLASWFGVTIIYDVHEDVPKDILEKYWIPRILRPLIARVVSRIQIVLSRRFNAIIAATPSIAIAFNPDQTSVINNYPSLADFGFAYSSREDRIENTDFLYLGAITEVRGLGEVIAALGRSKRVNAPKLRLAGPVSPPSYMAELEQIDGWKCVEYYSFVTRSELPELFDGVLAGIVTFHPEPNHVEAQPNKLFEYMAAGIPIIASNFPLWIELVEKSGCGLVVDPLDPDSILNAMNYLVDNPDIARKMGKAGRSAVLSRYNWDTEAVKLATLYQKIAQSVTMVAPSD